jgi:hypothetical protein
MVEISSSGSGEGPGRATAGPTRRSDQLGLVRKEEDSGSSEILFVVQRVRIPSGQS